MKISFMRFVDYFMGIPVCFLFTIISKIKLPFKRTLDKSKNQNILFIKLSEMGTTIFFPPLMKKLQEIYPNSTVYFLVFKQNSSIIKFLKLVPEKNILEVRTNNLVLFAMDLIKHLAFLKFKGISITIDYEFFSRVSSILSFIIHSKVRVGYDRFNWEGLYRGDLYTHKVNFNPFLHTAQNYLGMIKALAYAPGPVILKEKAVSLEEFKPTKLTFTSEEKEALFKKLNGFNSALSNQSKIIILNPDTGVLPSRKWPDDYFIQLGKAILEYDKKLFIVLTGTSKTVPLADKIRNAIGSNRVINLAGETTLRELYTLYEISKLMISADSGPVHFAALTNLKVICIFGPETPVAFSSLNENTTNLVSGFYCHPCISVFNNRLALCKHKQICLQSITPEQVMGEVEKVIG